MGEYTNLTDLGELVADVFGSRQALGLRELAAALGVHRETLARAVRRGRLPAFRVGARWRVARSGALAYLESCESRRPPTPRRAGRAAKERTVGTYEVPAGEVDLPPLGAFDDGPTGGTTIPF